MYDSTRTTTTTTTTTTTENKQVLVKARDGSKGKKRLPACMIRFFALVQPVIANGLDLTDDVFLEVTTRRAQRGLRFVPFSSPFPFLFLLVFVSFFLSFFSFPTSRFFSFRSILPFFSCSSFSFLRFVSPVSYVSSIDDDARGI